MHGCKVKDKYFCQSSELESSIASSDLIPPFIYGRNFCLHMCKAGKDLSKRPIAVTAVLQNKYTQDNFLFFYL